MYKGPLIDTDVHQSWRTTADLWPYMEQPWRDLANGTHGGSLNIIPPYRFSYRPAHGGVRPETAPPEGGNPGSSYPLMRDQLLDRYDIERAVLCFDSGRNNALPNPYFAQAVVRAMNDWNVDKWLGVGDKRLYGTVLVPGQFPDEAAAEIRRVGKDPRMVAALIGWNALSKPLGHPMYHPIYEAASELDLPIAIHIAAGEQSWGSAQSNAGGLPGNFFEFHNVFIQPMMHHLMSFIVHGVFEKYPNLKLFCIECGLAWIPWLLWNLDDHYKVLKHETLWMKKWPSDYFRDHVRFSTQPLEISPERDQLGQALSSVDGIEDILCFSTDYPHWDADAPRYVGGRLPRAWHEKLFYRNALDLFRWDRTPAREVVGAGASAIER